MIISQDPSLHVERQNVVFSYHTSGFEGVENGSVISDNSQGWDFLLDTFHGFIYHLKYKINIFLF